MSNSIIWKVIELAMIRYWLKIARSRWEHENRPFPHVKGFTYRLQVTHGRDIVDTIPRHIRRSKRR